MQTHSSRSKQHGMRNRRRKNVKEAARRAGGGREKNERDFLCATFFCVDWCSCSCIHFTCAEAGGRAAQAAPPPPLDLSFARAAARGVRVRGWKAAFRARTACRPPRWLWRTAVVISKKARPRSPLAAKPTRRRRRPLPLARNYSNGQYTVSSKVHAVFSAFVRDTRRVCADSRRFFTT